jgi:FxsC-like protein
LSYAHTPANSHVDGDPSHWVHQLYKDLCAAVMELTDLPEDEPPGFMDRGMHLGEGWAERIAEALAHCRVFVPLYSPRYFRSVACGQEWDAFASRPVYRIPRNSGHASGVVPALWVTLPQSSLPPVASRLQFNHSDFGQDYVREGLYALLKLNYFRDAYDLAVHRLAQRIVQVAEQTMIPVGRREDFLTRPCAFEDPVPSRQLRIAVLACDADKLPPGRSADAYGQSPLDWQPYRPDSSRPLVQHADRVARQLGFHPSIHDFEDEVEAVLHAEEPTAPGLLLLDRWALLDPARRELVKAFDQRNPSWISLMEPWNADDPECQQANGELQSAAEEALRHRRRDARPSLRGGSDGLPTLESFEAELPRAAQRAIYGFTDRGKPKAQAHRSPVPPTGGAASGRPSLRAVSPAAHHPTGTEYSQSDSSPTDPAEESNP